MKKTKKEILREQIQSEIEKFLARGGKIKVYKPILADNYFDLDQYQKLTGYLGSDEL